MSDRRINKNFTELDFEKVKESLVSFLKTQEEFQDYNFEGSALNVILNQLAYNTQYNAYYLNMHASERFISTAQRRDNVVNLARNLGYTSRSSKGAISFLDLRITPTENFTGTSITIPNGTIFSSSVEGDNLNFYTKESVVAEQDGDFFVVDGLEVFEGKKFTYRERFDRAKGGVTIPNPGVDIDNIKVTVKNNISDQIGISFTRADSFVNVQAISPVYFVEESYSERYRVFFGDNIVGLRPADNSVIEIEYFTNKGSTGNFAREYTYSGNIPEIEEVEVISAEPSFGGQDIESIESVRANAPISFTRQDRAVTAKDYSSVVRDIFPQASSVNSWGGEELTPPVLGYVFISVVKEEFDANSILSDIEKEFIEREIRENFSPASILPAVVDPEYTFIEVSAIANYDSNIVNPGELQLRSDILNRIFQFGLDNFAGFDATIRRSRVSRHIDDTDQSILSSNVTLRAYGESLFIEELRVNESVRIGTEIVPDTVESSFFKYGVQETAFFRDDSEGSLDLFIVNNLGVEELFISNVAEVNYLTGVINFNSNIDLDLLEFISGIDFRIFGLLPNVDVAFTFNRIPILRQSDISVSVKDISLGSV